MVKTKTIKPSRSREERIEARKKLLALADKMSASAVRESDKIFEEALRREGK